MNNKATLKYIAEKLHISISTVSRALKNHPDISEKTKEKVNELARLIDYEPNAFAINLRTNASKLFAVIVPSLANNNFYYSFITSLEEQGRKSGYSFIILQSGDDPRIEADNIRLCRSNRVAGVFASLSTHTRDIRPFLKLEELHIPVIFFDKVPPTETCNKVCLADEQAASLAAEKLAERNKKYILAIFGSPELLITKKRVDAFKKTLALYLTAKLPYKILYADSFEKARTATLVECRGRNQPDAIFCMSDEILTGVMKAIQQTGLKVPDDVSIISMSNDGFIPGMYEPAINYVETSGYKLGQLAYQRMTDHFNGKHFYRELISPSEYIEGGSL